MPSVTAGACLRQSLDAACGQSEHLVQFAIRQQSAIGGDHRTPELKHQAAVEIEPQRPAVRFTRQVCHRRPVRSRTRYCTLYDNQGRCTPKCGTVRGMRDQMGAERFKKTCAKDGVLITDEEAERVKQLYRASNPEIVRLWLELQQAAIRQFRIPETGSMRRMAVSVL